jgi:hypothetical protein
MGDAAPGGAVALPLLVRVLLKVLWGPAYAKRRHRLYQPLAANSRG